MLGACRVVGGDVLGLWQGRVPARTPQGRRVDEPKPKMYTVGRGRLVSRFGKNNVKSTTWAPSLSTPRRTVCKLSAHVGASPGSYAALEGAG